MYTPVIRAGVRECKNEMRDHYTVYLPAYDDKKIVKLLSRIPNVKWEIFSKHSKKVYHYGKLTVYPVDKKAFAQSMTCAKGILCGAGFETPAETLSLRKKLMVVPMKSQLEQHYNAASLASLGVPVIKKLRRKNLDKIIAWIESDNIVSVDYKNITADAVEKAVSMGKKL
jgi:uncharacterized protein (TIGR00661 family)